VVDEEEGEQKQGSLNTQGIFGMETFTSGQQRNQKAIAKEFESEEAIFKELIKRGIKGSLPRTWHTKWVSTRRSFPGWSRGGLLRNPKMMDLYETKGEIAEIQ